MFSFSLTRSAICSLIHHYISYSISALLAVCCYCVQLTNFALGIPILHIAGAIVGLVLLINVRSLPLVWHIRVLLPLGIVLCKYRILSLWHMITLQPVESRHRTVVHQLESCCPVGANPFEFTVKVTSWASPDETDWFGHVSNSNYAKARDVALAKFGIAAWPTFVNAGGWITLGSTHYRFLREIPRFAKYETSLSVGAWDDKWLYLVCRFTSPVTSHAPVRKTGNESSSSSSSATQTPKSRSRSGSTSESDGDHSDHSTMGKAAPAGAGTLETFHCYTVSRVCFKIGRITVPPALVMACEGFSKPLGGGGGGGGGNGFDGGGSAQASKVPPAAYSHQLPPPHWLYPHALRSAADSLDVYRRFLAGGWRDLPEGDRWWIEALSGVTEERRRANLAKLENIDRAMVDCMDIRL